MIGHNLLGRFLDVREVSGLHMRFGAEVDWSARLCVLEQQKQKLVRKGEIRSVKGWEALKEVLSEQLPVYLQLEGKGVLCKAVPQPVDTVEEAFEQVMPHARAEEFYGQLSTLDSQQWLCVVRREMLSSLLSDFLAKGYYVLGLGLGPFALQNVAPFLGEATVQLEGYSARISQRELLALSRNEEQGSPHYLVGDDRIGAVDLPAYATAVGAFVDRQGALDAELPALRQDEWHQKQLFLFSGKVILALLFVGMLVNALLNLQYTQEHEQLSFEAGRDEKLVGRLKELKEETQQKEVFLGQIGWEGTERLAFYADRLAVSLPKGVCWTRLEIYPVDEHLLKKEKQYHFDKGRLHVEGYCEGPLMLNGWLNVIGKLEWVDEVANQQYAYDRREEKGKFMFDLMIKR